MLDPDPGKAGSECRHVPACSGRSICPQGAPMPCVEGIKQSLVVWKRTHIRPSLQR